MSDIQLDFNQLKLTVMMLQAEMESLSDDVWRENQFVGNDDGDSFPWSDVSLGYTRSGSTVTIYAGSIRLHGIGNYAVSQANVTLTGITEWVYVQQGIISPGTTSIEHSSTEPESNGTHRKLPLFKFTASAGVYSLTQICHMGDFNFETPINT